jgi:hypothetical protein
MGMGSRFTARRSRFLPIMAMAVLALGGCGGIGGKAVEVQHKQEHPCEFKATLKQCAQVEAREKREEEARHETGALRKRARLEAEQARLKKEAGARGLP